MTAIDPALALARDAIAPLAAAIDSGDLSASQSLQLICDAGLAGLPIGRSQGGKAFTSEEELRVLETFAAADGTTAFLIAQHYGASRLCMASENGVLTKDLLPRLASGEIIAGFGISHVRRAGPPMLRAVRCNNGYILNGDIPWITGYGLFSYIIVGATLPDGDILLAWLPFEADNGWTIHQGARLVAMNAARTVSATLHDVLVRDELILAIEPVERRSAANKTSAPCLFGIARACLDDLNDVTQPAGAANARETLSARLEQQRIRYYAALQLPAIESEVAIDRARALALALSLDAIMSLIITTGGRANDASHPAQRRLREASVFATWGLSATSTDAALHTLANGH